MKGIFKGFISAAVLLSMLTGCGDVDKEKYINSSSQSSEVQNAQNAVLDSAALADWTSLTFGIDGVGYTLEFNLSDLKNSGWSFDPGLYGLTDYTIAPTTKLSCDVYLDREGCDDGVFAVGFTNTGSAEVPLDDGQVWAVRVDIKDKSNYPSFSIPGNIQWNASQDDIKTALGEPSETKQEEAGCTELVYNKDGNRIVHYYVYDDGGLQKFWIEKY